MNALQFSLLIPLVLLAATSAFACSAPVSSQPRPPEAVRPDPVARTAASQRHSTAQRGSTAQTALNLRAANLHQPHRLVVRSTGTLTGQITLDGEVIQQLRSNQAEVDLASYLSSGQHEVEIVGSYAPATANVSIEFTAPGTSVMQQTSGNGVLRQTLSIRVEG